MQIWWLLPLRRLSVWLSDHCQLQQSFFTTDAAKGT
jgi:hypothetical protein